VQVLVFDKTSLPQKVPRYLLQSSNFVTLNKRLLTYLLYNTASEHIIINWIQLEVSFM